MFIQWRGCSKTCIQEYPFNLSKKEKIFSTFEQSKETAKQEKLGTGAYDEDKAVF